MPFTDSPEGKTHADVFAHFYQKGYDEGRLDVLHHLLQIDEEGRNESLRDSVNHYAQEHDIKL